MVHGIQLMRGVQKGVESSGSQVGTCVGGLYVIQLFTVFYGSQWYINPESPTKLPGMQNKYDQSKYLRDWWGVSSSTGIMDPSYIILNVCMPCEPPHIFRKKRNIHNHMIVNLTIRAPANFNAVLLGFGFISS